MIIYFNASLLGKEKYLKEFRLIDKIVKDLGHQIFSDQILKRDHKVLDKMTKKQHETDFQKVRKEIQKSDVMIVESTYPSVGVGHVMSIALEMRKHVLVLTQILPHGLLIGDPNRLLTIKKYNKDNPNELRQIIKSFLDKSKRRLLKKRFNFMIDSIQEDFLEIVSKKLLISKADYVRRLLNEKLQKSKDTKALSLD